jgi:hypothetical protein
MTLAMMFVFVLWAMGKAKNPRTWLWLTGGRGAGDVQPAPTGAVPGGEKQRPPSPPRGPSAEVRFYAGQLAGFLALGAEPTLTPDGVRLRALGVLGQEHVPEAPAAAEQPAAGQRAPVANPEFLRGALDRREFLLENPADPDNVLYARDADARYYLLELARDANPADLAADARRDVRYTALLEKPQDYRGQVIHVQGDLLWVTHFELKRSVPGLPHVYQGLLLAEPTGRPVWLLFPELPPGLPPEAQWSRLYLNGVRFDGYFLKVLRAEDPKEKGKQLYFPVLVGRTLTLAAPAVEMETGLSWPFVLIVGGGILGVFAMAAWLYRRSERRYEAKLARLRAQAESARPREERRPAEPPAAEGQPPEWLQ